MVIDLTMDESREILRNMQSESAPINGCASCCCNIMGLTEEIRSPLDMQWERSVCAQNRKVKISAKWNIKMYLMYVGCFQTGLSG